MTQSINQINRRVTSFTNVVKLVVSANETCSVYELVVTLANDSGDSISLKCADVSRLRVFGFGGGLTQIVGLRGKNVQADQIDRVNFHFSDAEQDAIEFDCAAVGIFDPTD